MTTEEMQSLARLDDAVDRLADGCFSDSSEDMPKYDIRAMVSEINRLGRSLIDDEVEKIYHRLNQF